MSPEGLVRLANRELAVDLLDPVRHGPLLGTRFAWGGLIWDVRDPAGRRLVSGPEGDHPAPAPFNARGLPESFRHTTRSGRPLTWQGDHALAVGIGILVRDGAAVAVAEPCVWDIQTDRASYRARTGQALGELAYVLVRSVRIEGGRLVSASTLTNAGAARLSLQWFAHPFFPLEAGRLEGTLPTGTALPENPGFALDEGLLHFRRPFVGELDNQFVLLEWAVGTNFAASLSHPSVGRVRVGGDFVPDECPVWANRHTFSIEPYLYLDLAPGESRSWSLTYDFGDRSLP